jgi:hypothetical protein
LYGGGLGEAMPREIALQQGREGEFRESFH